MDRITVVYLILLVHVVFGKEECLGDSRARMQAGFLPDHYYFRESDGHCFLVTKEPMNFTQCQQYCMDHANGTLANVKSEHDRQYFNLMMKDAPLSKWYDTYLKKPTSFSYVFIGLYQDPFQQWRWVNNLTVQPVKSDRFWVPNEPKEKYGNCNTDCGIMDAAAAFGPNVIAGWCHATQGHYCLCETSTRPTSYFHLSNERTKQMCVQRYIGESMNEMISALIDPIFLIATVSVIVMNLILTHFGHAHRKNLESDEGRSRQMSVVSAVRSLSENSFGGIEMTAMSARENDLSVGQYTMRQHNVELQDEYAKVNIPFLGAKILLIDGKGGKYHKILRTLFRILTSLWHFQIGIRSLMHVGFADVNSSVYVVNAVFGVFIFVIYGQLSTMLGEKQGHFAAVIHPLTFDREAFKKFWSARERNVRLTSVVIVLVSLSSTFFIKLLFSASLASLGMVFICLFTLFESTHVFVEMLRILTKGHTAQIKNIKCKALKSLKCPLLTGGDFDTKITTTEMIKKPSELKKIVAQFDNVDLKHSQLMHKSQKLCGSGVYLMIFCLCGFMAFIANAAFGAIRAIDTHPQLVYGLLVTEGLLFLISMYAFYCLLDMISDVGECYKTMLKTFIGRADVHVRCKEIFGDPICLHRRYANHSVMCQHSWLLFGSIVDRKLVGQSFGTLARVLVVTLIGNYFTSN